MSNLPPRSPPLGDPWVVVRRRSPSSVREVGRAASGARDGGAVFVSVGCACCPCRSIGRSCRGAVVCATVGTGGGGALAKSGETDRWDPIRRAWRGLAVCNSRCAGRSVKVMVMERARARPPAAGDKDREEPREIGRATLVSAQSFFAFDALEDTTRWALREPHSVRACFSSACVRSLSRARGACTMVAARIPRPIGAKALLASPPARLVCLC